MAQKLWKVGNFISQLTCPNIVSAHETGKINLQFCVCSFSVKRLGIFLLFPGRDASPSQGYP